MKIFLINTPDNKHPVARDMMGGLGFDGGDDMKLPPLDLLSYAATLQKKGHTITLLDSQVEFFSPEEIIQQVVRSLTDAVMITLSLPTIEADIAFSIQLYNRLPKRCPLFIKTGITYAPILTKILTETRAFCCIIGECDLTIDTILSQKNRKGTAWMSNNSLQTEQEDLLENLDVLPLLPRTLLPTSRYTYPLTGKKTTTMQTSRGCPFSCGYYCPYPLVQGKKWRSMSPERIIDEIKNIIKNNEADAILFRDATFTLNKERVKKFCTLLLDQSIRIDWWCETRINCMDTELATLMKQSGCRGMNVGIETGDDSTLTAWAKEGVTIEKIIFLVDHCKRIGLKLHFLLIAGLPGETRQSLYETFTLIDKLKPESIGMTSITPYPGTPLYDDAIKKGWIEYLSLSLFGGHGFSMNTDDLNVQEMEFACAAIVKLFKLNQQGKDGEYKKKELQGIFKKWVAGETKGHETKKI